MGETETVTISVAEYEELQDAANFLAALEAHGVDNWIGYDDATQAYHEENDK